MTEKHENELIESWIKKINTKEEGLIIVQLLTKAIERIESDRDKVAELASNNEYLLLDSAVFRLPNERIRANNDFIQFNKKYRAKVLELLDTL